MQINESCKMRYQLCILIVFFAWICSTGNSVNQTATPPEVNVTISDAIARKVLSFALNLSTQMGKDYRKTLIFSPLSIMTSLAMLMIGAREKTLLELSTLFGQSNVDKFHEQFALMLSDVEQTIRETTSPLRETDAWHNDGTENSLITYPMYRNGTQQVRIANAVFVQQQYKINPEHRKAMSSIYKSDLLTVDFKKQRVESTNTINIWINLQTNNKVDEMVVNEFNDITEKVFVSVLSIKAAWEIDFIRGLTKKQDFYPNGKEMEQVVSARMMTGAGSFPYYQDLNLGCRIIGIPYDGGMMTMYIIQPVFSSVDQLKDLQRNLTAARIENMIRKMRRASAVVVLPKMHLQESHKLREPLKKLGVGGVFDEMHAFKNKKAASRGSLATKVPYSLTVSEIFHTLVFNVEEHGTEADSATLVPLFRAGYDVIFRVDTPFILLVRNDLTKLPLIYGVINEPPLDNY